MTVVFAIVLVVHGLIHVLGFAKAFGLAELPQLTQPIFPFLGALWLFAALLFLATAAALFIWPRGWWAIGACAIVVSMFVIVPSWTDAKFGALANLVALIGVVFGFLAHGPVSLRAAYDRDVDRALARVAPAEPIKDANLAHLPAPVQRYLRGAGVVGQPSNQDELGRSPVLSTASADPSKFCPSTAYHQPKMPSALGGRSPTRSVWLVPSVMSAKRVLESM